MNNHNRQAPPFGQYGSGIPIIRGEGEKMNNSVEVVGHLVNMGTLVFPLDTSGKNFRTIISEGISKWEQASIMIQAANPDKPAEFCVAKARNLLEEIVRQTALAMEQQKKSTP